MFALPKDTRINDLSVQQETHIDPAEVIGIEVAGTLNGPSMMRVMMRSGHSIELGFTNIGTAKKLREAILVERTEALYGEGR